MAPHNPTNGMEFQNQPRNVRFYFIYHSECKDILLVLVYLIPLR